MVVVIWILVVVEEDSSSSKMVGICTHIVRAGPAPSYSLSTLKIFNRRPAPVYNFYMMGRVQSVCRSRCCCCCCVLFYSISVNNILGEIFPGPLKPLFGAKQWYHIEMVAWWPTTILTICLVQSVTTSQVHLSVLSTAHEPALLSRFQYKMCIYAWRISQKAIISWAPILYCVYRWKYFLLSSFCGLKREKEPPRYQSHSGSIHSISSLMSLDYFFVILQPCRVAAAVERYDRISFSRKKKLVLFPSVGQKRLIPGFQLAAVFRTDEYIKPVGQASHTILFPFDFYESQLWMWRQSSIISFVSYILIALYGVCTFIGESCRTDKDEDVFVARPWWLILYRLRSTFYFI